jgi:hypothetical protein
MTDVNLPVRFYENVFLLFSSFSFDHHNGALLLIFLRTLLLYNNKA